MEFESSNHSNSKKKINPTDREETASTFMLRCAEFNLSAEDLDEMTMGMVYDMLIEKNNDSYDYAEIAPQGSMSAFFGGKGV